MSDNKIDRLFDFFSTILDFYFFLPNSNIDNCQNWFSNDNLKTEY